MSRFTLSVAHWLLLIGLVALLVGARWNGVGALPPASSPILVVVDPSSANPFGAYLGEILRAEGINSHQTAGPADLTSQYLASFQTVILAEMALSSSQATLLTSYVSGGGTLIAMRPDPLLTPVFGLAPASGTTANAYILVDAGHPVGAGIAGQTMQTHSVADHYTVNGGSVVAALYSDASAPTAYPAVVVNSYGAGRSAAFAYDLAKAVAYLRQGNPVTAGTDANGDGIIRTTDGFIQWIDLERIHIPQADEQQRLLANLITYFGKQTMPIPRIWYFPTADEKAMLVVTGDDHGTNAEVQQMVAIVESHGGRATVYVPRWASLDLGSMQTWRSRGHEFGMHPKGIEDGETLDQGYADNLGWFTGQYGVPPSATVRNHDIEWQGWVDAAKVAQNYGVRMDTSYYHWGSGLRRSSSDLVATGYLTASGLPMRFVDGAGSIVPVYQQLTQLVDEFLFSSTDAGGVGLSPDQGTVVARQLIDGSVGGNYSAVTMQAHVGVSDQWLDNVTAYAQSQGVPIWTSERWLGFTEARHNAVLDQFSWNPTAYQLSFSFSSSTSEPASTLLVPADYRLSPVGSVTVDGVPVLPGTLAAKGFIYRTIPVASGIHTIVVTYNSAATVTPTAVPTPPWINMPFVRR